MLPRLLALATFGLTPVAAAVIDFNAVPSSGNPIRTSLTTQGFVFTSAHFHAVDSPGICDFGGCVSNGTIYLAVDAPGLGFPIVMTASGGAAFSLSGLDASKMWLDNAAAAAGGFANAVFLGLSATVNGGGTLSTNFTLSSAAAFQHFTLPDTWTNLVSVTFNGITASTLNTSFAIDNITVNAVPEPTTLILAGLTLLAIAGAGAKTRTRKG